MIDDRQSVSTVVPIPQQRLKIEGRSVNGEGKKEEETDQKDIVITCITAAAAAAGTRYLAKTI